MVELDTDLLSSIASLLGLDTKTTRSQSDSTFIELGGDSVKALELTFRLDAVGKTLDVKTILAEESTIHHLSHLLAHNAEESRTSDTDSSSQSSTPKTISSGNSASDPDTSASLSLCPSSTLREEACSRLACANDQIEAVLPLTAQQTGLWLGSLKTPGAYITRWHYLLPTYTDLVKLDTACGLVLAAIPILRSRILMLSDHLLHQVVLKYNRHNTSLVEQRYEAHTVKANYGAPLFGFHIDQCEHQKKLLLVCHHALYDRWSMRLILQDLNHAYHHSTVPSIRPSYFALFESSNNTESAQLKGEWRAEIKDEPLIPAPRVTLPDHSIEASSLLEITVPCTSTSHATKAELIAAAWSFVCFKHADSTRISFGITLSGRDIPQAGVTEMAFPTFRTLPFCASMQEDDATIQLITRTKAYLSFLRRVQRLDIESISSLGPAYREACHFHSILVIQQDMSLSKDLDLGLFDPKHLLSFQTSQSNPLVIECTPRKDETLLSMKFDSNCIPTFDAETMLHHLQTALEVFSSGHDMPLNRVDLFNEHDKLQVTQWNAPPISLRKLTLHSLVLDQVKRRPDATALWQTNRSLTYGELLAMSKKVMAVIARQNSQRTPNVGVCFEKSFLGIVSMLGASMSGCAFVPMDASNPMSRLLQIIEDAEISLVLCSVSQASKFEKEGVKTLIIDEDFLANTSHQNMESPGPTIDSKSFVYIIYTSGSTGKPKGVDMTHGALCTAIHAISQRLEFSEETRTLQFSSFAFDMSVHDIWCTLITGGVVCIPSESERFELEHFISRAQCNYAMLTPSVASLLPEQSWKRFNKLSLGGEVMSSAIVSSVLQAGVKLWNVYGPTEACVICLADHVASMDVGAARLGHGLTSNAWILDRDDPHRLAPAGCVGELALSGPTLATGYHRDIEKTEHAFLKGLTWIQMFPHLKLDRVYRTGDLARYNCDGSIEFQGRSGGYIKIAGNRVDLGEIENALRNKSGLSNVSVQYCQIGHPDARDLLVAFCRLYPSQSGKGDRGPELLPATANTREIITKCLVKLTDVLPHYMIPSILIPLDKFPCTSTGKLDSRLLKDMVSSQNIESLITRYGIDSQATDTSQISPDQEILSDRAKLLKECWASVLKTSSLSISSGSNFFKVGGDSLSAMQLGASVRQAGYSLRVPEIFRNPTLAEMSEKLTEIVAEADVEDKIETMSPGNWEFWRPGQYEQTLTHASERLQLHATSVESLVPCSSLQTQILAAAEQAQGTYIHRESFVLHANVSDNEIEKVCRCLFATNQLLRSRAFVDPETGLFFLAVLRAEAVPMELIRMDSSVESYMNGGTVHARNSLGIDRYLCRFILLTHAGTRRLLWEMHHSIYDGYSHPLLLQQLHDSIGRMRRSLSPSASEDQAGRKTPVQFENYIREIHRMDKQDARAFWSRYLADSVRAQLPFQRNTQGGHGSSSATATATASTTNRRATRSIDLSRPASSGFTWATYIRAAFAYTLHRYTQASDILFGTTINGRDLPVHGIEDIIGPTFATLPVRCRIDTCASLDSLLSRVQAEAAEMASHQHLSVDEIGCLSDAARQACRFQIHLLVQQSRSQAQAGDAYAGLAQLGYQCESESEHEQDTQLPRMSLSIPFNLAATVKTEGGVHLEVLYSDDIFPTEYVSLLLDMFVASLTQMLCAGAADTVVGEICSMGKENQLKILSIQPTDEESGCFADTTIPQLVFGALDGRRHNQAIYSSLSTFNYQELYELCSGLAQTVRSFVGSDRRYVAVCYEKSPWAIIAQLAVLMAGFAYMTVDPAWPVARQRGVLAQIDCPLIVTSASLENKMRDLNITEVAVADKGNCVFTAGHRSSANGHDFKASPHDPAYVIFTSGSTGTPKGVVVKHRSICRTLLAYADRLKFTHATRALQFASFSFDASVMETWSVLAAGGTLCLPDDDERLGGLTDFISSSKADCVALTPTTAMLVDAAASSEHIKTLLLCGEKCRPRDVDRWKHLSTSLVLVNAYGPSEASVNAVMNTQLARTAVDDIGRSMGGGLWVGSPDDHDDLVPVGVVGELLITGPVLAAEYLNDAEKTAQKFVHPQWPTWTKTNKPRAYKTGDLVRLDAQGRLHFVGRHDGQVKVNGVRIEAEEIESVVVAHPEIRVQEVGVGLCSLNEGLSELALYFVPADRQKGSTVEVLALRQEDGKTSSQLQTVLASALPRSHLPQLYIPISAIPQSTSGKVDRKRLSQLLAQLHRSQIAAYRVEVGTESEPASTRVPGASSPNEDDLSSTTATEQKLIRLWTQSINKGASTASITRQSHFIRSGGDSIAAIRMSNLAQSQGIRLPVKTIYANLVLSEMASAVEAEEGREPERSVLLTPEPFELLSDLSPSSFSPGPRPGRAGARGDYFGSLV